MQEATAKQVAQSAFILEDLQEKVERVVGDAHLLKDDLLSNEAKMEVWQKELREIRRMQLPFAPKLEDKSGRPPPSSESRRQGGGPGGPEGPAWPPQKKQFA